MLRYQPDLPKRRVVGGGTREITELLFRHGMNPNHPNWLRITPLHHFAASGDAQNAAIFIEHGPDLNAVDTIKSFASSSSSRRPASCPHTGWRNTRRRRMI
jgi:ankyrin repeat protein